MPETQTPCTTVSSTASSLRCSLAEAESFASQLALKEQQDQPNPPTRVVGFGKLWLSLALPSRIFEYSNRESASQQSARHPQG